jgi:SAM-dependent methyltransferase
MLAQRGHGSAPAIRAVAEALPFRDRSFDAALAVLTIHHWSNQRVGLEECARVARQRVVIFTWDPNAEGFWLVQDYFPEILALDRRIFPSLAMVADILRTVDVRTVPIPADCVDGFLGAYWRRPEAYLDPAIRDGISSFSRIDPASSLVRLRDDLMSGAWEQRHANLLDRADLDIGYRLVVADWSRA